jgi:DNA-binding NarL/FixJ family response regulator
VQTADHELSEEEVEEHFGGLFREFHEALTLDPLVLVQMVERIEASRRVNAEKAAQREERRRLVEAGRESALAARAKRDAKVLVMFRSGVTKTAIARELHLTGATVRKILAESADTPA